MGSTLTIIGNHQLKFSSGKEVIHQFETILNTKIKNGNYQSEEVKNKHENPEKIDFFAAYDYLDHNFNTWNEVRIMTNFKYCSEINIHKNTLSYNNGCRYKYWVANLFEENNQEDLKEMYKFCQLYWNEVHKFSKNITTQIGGDLQIYFEDSRFQEEIDLHYEGKTLRMLFEAMKKKWAPTELHEAPKRKNEFLVKNGWYFEKINNSL